MTLDYEMSAMKAIRNTFPNGAVRGSHYHFCSSLFKKAKRLGIKSRVERRHVAQCAGLARLPLKYIMAGYKYIMTRSPKSKPIQVFNNYLDRYWFNDIHFIKTWCCYGEDYRATNNLEGWHARLNRLVGNKNPSLAKVLDALINETRIALANKVKKSSNKNYQAIDEEISSAICQLKNGHISVGHCLEIVAPFNY